MSYHTDRSMGLLPTVPEGGAPLFALLGVGLLLSYMVLRPKKKR